jgi:hypothetical protein
MKLLSLLIGVLCFLSHFAEFTAAQDASLKEILAPLVKLLECDKGPPEIQQLCQLVAAKIQPELKAACITIQENDILFSYYDPTNVGIDTGHGCTVTAHTQEPMPKLG